MQISAFPMPGNPDRDKVKAFLLKAFANDPNAKWDIRGVTTIFINGLPMRIRWNTYWTSDGENIYLAKPGTEGGVGFTDEFKVGVYHAIAQFWDLDRDEQIAPMIIEAYTRLVLGNWARLEEATSIRDNQGRRVEWIAKRDGEIAGLVADQWVRPSGEVVTIDESWVRMAVRR